MHTFKSIEEPRVGVLGWYAGVHCGCSSVFEKCRLAVRRFRRGGSETLSSSVYTLGSSCKLLSSNSILLCGLSSREQEALEYGMDEVLIVRGLKH